MLIEHYVQERRSQNTEQKGRGKRDGVGAYSIRGWRIVAEWINTRRVIFEERGGDSKKVR